MKLPKFLRCAPYSICRICKVHFEPVPEHESAWNDLCEQHRRPLIDEYRRKEAVAEWARKHWVKLEPVMRELEEKEYEQRKAMFENAMQIGNYQKAKMTAQQGSLNSGNFNEIIRGVFGLGI